MSSLKGDEIVITGISGIFPEAESVQQLSEKLYNKIDMVKKSDRHSNIKHPEFPQYFGSINGMEKFDAHFFRVTPKQATCMDPMTRKLMEQTMSALFDAGINPEIVKNSRLGVFMASTTVDSFNNFFNDTKGHPFILTGSCKCMFANRISYWIDGKGPSYTLDHGYVGSMSALEMAYNAMRTNLIDCAIVGGCNYCTKPELTLNMKRAGLLCLDGKTKCFDKNGDGFVRSDAINVYFLQKAKDAKRIYSEVYYVKGKYFASPDGLFSPKRNPEDIEQFFEEFYSEIDVDINDVEYIEANSFGIAEADGNELEAVGNVFAKEKNNVRVGSIKSNMGHTECASGACSITKMCLAYHNGHIPANLHYKEPQSHVTAIQQGKIKVVTENEPFCRSFTAINNFCYTGSNFHALLKGHYKPKDKERYKSNIPRLVLVSSRKEEGVNKILDNLESHPIDAEQLALLNNVYKYYIPGYTARGYTVLGSNDKNETVPLSRGFEYFSGNTRPVWFLYSGMGSQWAGMGEGLLHIPVFAAAIDRCHNVLINKGLNLIEILTNKDINSLDILKSFVAITAVQIGLTDVLKSIGIVPDNLIGHSLGEICCAYADGALTTEETILAAYFRAIVSYETKFIKGTMAAIGLGYKEKDNELLRSLYNILKDTPVSVLNIDMDCQDMVAGLSIKLVKRWLVLLASYQVSQNTTFPATMRSANMRTNKIVKLCPPGIEVACHNSSESSTISGPSDIVSVFVKSLTDQGIFAKEVASYNIAFHSKYIAEAGPKMYKLLETIIKNPKARSNKWLSTCYLPENWHKVESKYASAAYFTHNLMNSVLFEEAASLIPDDAIIIEIAPHGLLQAIMKRSHSTCVNLSLTRRNENDSVLFILKAIGDLYKNGINPDLVSLYPEVEFPVSTETPLLSHLVAWDHDTHWMLKENNEETESSITKEFIFSLYDDNFVFLQNYVRNGKNILPEAAVLVFAWETLASIQKKECKNTSVQFNKVKFHKEVAIQLDEVIKLEVSIQTCSGKFEVLHKNYVIADGIIYLVKKSNKRSCNILGNETDKHLTQNDIYTLLRIRGHSYENEFQSIKSMNIKRNKATITWNEKYGWINFLDSVFLVQALSNDYGSSSCVKHIIDLTIDVDEHLYKSFSLDGAYCYNVLVTKETGVIECGGVVVKDMIIEEIPNINMATVLQNDLKINIFGNKNVNDQNDIKRGTENKTRRLKLILNERNNIESLTWADAPVTSNKTTIQIHYSGFSSRDVKYLSSSDNNNFGMDFSGVDKNGKRVMGIVPCGAVSSTVEADHELLWPVPQHWSLADAATVPLPYIHAFYCLKIRHTLSRNSTILVIGAAGALGQAVISIALHEGCRIFGTVGNADKKKYLLRIFPALDENNIGYTYDDTFRAMVSQRTKNKKCNIVINTASGKVREDAMSCVGADIFNNFFLDVNDSDSNNNEPFRMAYLDEERSYKTVNMASIFEVKFHNHKKVLQNMLYEGISKGFVRPLTHVIYSPCDVTRAFKLLSNRRHIGRVIISIKDLETPKQDLSPIPRMVFYPNKAYIVVCDGSELGVELIHLLIKRGAKRLLIHCSPKTINGYFHVRYASWKNQGATIEINSDDLRIEEKCKKFVEDVKNLGFTDIDGIFVAHSGFAKKSITISQDTKDIALIVSNLDKNTRDYKNLRYFAIVIAATEDSSNTYEEKELEKCCVRRNHLGLPSLYLRHVLDAKVWDSTSLQILFSGLETSLKQKFVSVSTCSVDSSNTTKTEKENTKFNDGISVFYSKNITKHEIDTMEPIIQMKTKSSSDNQQELTYDPDDTNIILIPGFDGNSENLCNIAERLKEPAIALQFYTNTNNSISEIAKTLLNHIKMRFRLKSPFYLMGYSFGVNVALEIAALLEKEGLIGVVYCLDSSPDAVRSHLDAYLGNLTEEQLQDSLIEHIYTLFVGHQSNELKVKLQDEVKWTDKVELFVNYAKTETLHSHEYMKTFLQAAYNRIQMAKVYKPNFVLKSELVLIKGIPHPNARDLTSDYNLPSYTNRPVQVFSIKSDHAMALNDCRVSNFINRHFI